MRQTWAEVGARRLDAKLRLLDASNIDLYWPKPLPAGPARLTLHFSGTRQDKNVPKGRAPGVAPMAHRCVGWVRLRPAER